MPGAASSAIPAPVASATAAAGAGRNSLFSNQTPELHPTQSGQSAGGVVTGLLNATDPDSTSLSYSVADTPAHGTVAVSAAGEYTYTPGSAV